MNSSDATTTDAVVHNNAQLISQYYYVGNTIEFRTYFTHPGHLKVIILIPSIFVSIMLTIGYLRCCKWKVYKQLEQYRKEYEEDLFKKENLEVKNDICEILGVKHESDVNEIRNKILAEGKAPLFCITCWNKGEKMVIATTHSEGKSNVGYLAARVFLSEYTDVLKQEHNHLTYYGLDAIDAVVTLVIIKSFVSLRYELIPDEEVFGSMILMVIFFSVLTVWICTTCYQYKSFGKLHWDWNFVSRCLLTILYLIYLIIYVFKSGKSRIWESSGKADYCYKDIISPIYAKGTYSQSIQVPGITTCSDTIENPENVECYNFLFFKNLILDAYSDTEYIDGKLWLTSIRVTPKRRDRDDFIDRFKGYEIHMFHICNVE